MDKGHESSIQQNLPLGDDLIAATEPPEPELEATEAPEAVEAAVAATAAADESAPPPSDCEEKDVKAPEQRESQQLESESREIEPESKPQEVEAEESQELAQKAPAKSRRRGLSAQVGSRIPRLCHSADPLPPSRVACHAAGAE